MVNGLHLRVCQVANARPKSFRADRHQLIRQNEGRPNSEIHLGAKPRWLRAGGGKTDDPGRQRQEIRRLHHARTESISFWMAATSARSAGSAAMRRASSRSRWRRDSRAVRRIASRITVDLSTFPPED